MDESTTPADARVLTQNQFRLDDIAPGQIGLVRVEDQRVAVYNVDGVFYATEERCVHAGWPLSDGAELDGKQLTCPLHNWCYDVTTGEVLRGMKSLRLKVFQVICDGDVGIVEPAAQ
jgi:nitrite reductase/ring-hydroxylating ferredoxin subunit